MILNKKIKLIHVGFISAFTIVFVIGYFLFNAFDENKNNEQLVNKSYAILATSKHLFSLIEDVETAQRGFVITNNPKYLEPLNKSDKIKDSLYKSLSILINNNPKKVIAVNDIKNHINSKCKYINNVISICKKNGQTEAIHYLSKGTGKVIMDSIHTTFDKFDKAEKIILTNQLQKLRESNKKVKNILIFGICVVVIIFFINYRSIYTQLSKIKKSEEQLYIHNEWYNQTLTSMGDAVITTDTIGIITTINKAATELTGWTNDDAKGKNIDQVVQLIELSTGNKVDNPIFNSLNNSNLNSSNDSCVLIKKNGKKIFVENNGAPIHDKKGTIIGAIHIFRDITAKVKAEKERDMVYDISIDMIAIADAEGCFKKVNPAFKDILGFELNEFISASVFEFIYEDDYEICKSELEKLNLGQPTVNFVARFKCKNGVIKWLEWNVVPVDDVLYGNGRDITEKHFAAKKIEASRRKFYKILESNPVSIAITDLKKRKFVYVNSAFCRLSGYSREQLLDQSLRTFQMVDEIAVLKAINKIHQNNGFAQNIDAKFKIQNGTEIDVLFCSEIIEIDNNPCYLTSIMDITERKKLEEKIIILNQNLERKVIERTEELEKQKKFTENILNKIPTEIAVYDKNQNYLYVNPACIKNEEIRNWVIGHNDIDYCKLNGDNYDLAEKKRIAFEKIIKDKQHTEWIDKIVLPNDTKIYMLRILHPIEDEDKYILTGYDITDLKLAEQAKEDYINNLEQMMFMTSHNLRLPVSNIVGLADLMEESMTKEEITEIVEHLKISIQSLDNFTKELTFFIHDIKVKTGRVS